MVNRKLGTPEVSIFFLAHETQSLTHKSMHSSLFFFVSQKSLIKYNFNTTKQHNLEQETGLALKDSSKTWAVSRSALCHGPHRSAQSAPPCAGFPPVWLLALSASPAGLSALKAISSLSFFFHFPSLSLDISRCYRVSAEKLRETDPLLGSSLPSLKKAQWWTLAGV